MSVLQVDVELQRDAFHLQLDISNPQPGVTVLFGRSGCGKTTAINLIAGLLTPDRGRIQLDDVVLFDSQRGINLRPEQRRIGYVFQQPRLFPHYTVRGNLLYGRKRSGADRQLFEFEQIVALLGLNTLLERPPRELSGGEQQRVSLGRALLSQPRMLLLDEPLASLDQARREEVLPYLERIRDELGIPMVYVSHQFEEVLRLADQVVLLDQGRVMAQGSLPDISLQPALRQIIGAEAMGTILLAQVLSVDAQSGLATLRVGAGQLQVTARNLTVNQTVRLQLLARDLILALEMPRGLSVRNYLQGVVTALSTDDDHATLVSVDVGGITLVARITTAAVNELHLQVGMTLWVLVKAITLRGHVYPDMYFGSDSAENS